MHDFSVQLLETLSLSPVAWWVLPNHYHLLIRSDDIKKTVSELGRLHGRTYFQWNGQDGLRGRQVWHSASDRAMRNEEHFWATVNYIHHNPVKHGHVGSWWDWPYSSAVDFLEAEGTGEAARIWKDYPVLDYGKGWDD